MKILITRPCYDDGTSYLFYYAGIIIKEANSRGLQVIDLKRPRLNRTEFTSIVTKQKPELIFFNAHGDQSVIYGDKTGENEEILIAQGENQELLDSKIVYARACWSAASLGKTCKDGCFIGYRFPFTFLIDEQWVSNPLKDNTARLFLEPSNTIIQSLIKGNPVKNAVEKCQNESKKNMLELLKQKEEPGAMASLMALWNNITGLEAIGNQELTFCMQCPF